MKTPTPTVNVLSTFGNPPFISGWVGEVSASGVKTPEVGAYIYIYIDGFLVNPPSYDDKGEYNNPVRIISGPDGSWSTTAEHENITLIYIKPGGVLTTRAKSQRKDISDLSTPYVMQGMVTPINLGVVGDFDTVRPPNDGEYILTGKFSYWDPEIFLKCNNRVLIYNDGYYIGEVLKNTVRGSDASFPITSDINNLRFSLLVNGKIVTLNLGELNIDNKVVISGLQDGKNAVFTFPVRNVYSDFKVYNNIRLSPNGIPADYNITVNTDTKIATVTFLIPPEPTDFVSIYEVNKANAVYNEDLIINSIMRSQPDPYTLQVFQNGLHLERGTDYTVSGIDITFTIPVEGSDKIVVDYQKIDETIPIIFTPPITQTGALEFSLPIMAKVGRIYVYKNGILQYEKTSTFPGTYTVTKNINNVLITFQPNTLDLNSGDLLTINYEYTPLYQDILVEWLNTLIEFEEYCLHASIYSSSASITSFLNNYVVGDGTNLTYYLPKYDVSTSTRLFKNGIRLVQDRNYKIKNEVITFANKNKSTDQITSVIQYNDKSLVVNGSFYANPNTPQQITTTLTPLRNIGLQDETIQLYKNGKRLSPFTYAGNHAEYTVSGNTIVLFNSVLSSDSFMVDYQVSSASTRYVYVRPFITIPDGDNKEFNFLIPPLGAPWNIEVFKNGLKLNKSSNSLPGQDYFISDNKIVFTSAPKVGDNLLIDFYIEEFNLTGEQSQISFESGYPLELVIPPLSQEEYNTYRAIFGSKYIIDPGKDTDGEFLYHIKGDTGEWKYTNLDLLTRVPIPFNKGEHLAARALHSNKRIS